jgi:GNAT superfamily N-acetyltransferase
VNSPIVRAGHADAEWVADLIGGQFQHLGVAAWLVPDPDARARVLPRNFQIFVEYALAYGEVHVLADRSAAAVWIPRDETPLPPPDDYDARVANACGEWTDRFFELDELFERHHPVQPHHHLAFLAVRKDRQGTGLGSTLLDHHHAYLDGAGISAFLEASSVGARDLYLRHGYQPHGDPYPVPNGALFWPLWRTPR